MINFVRNIGGSIGIALISTYITRDHASAASYLSANMQTRQSRISAHDRGLSATLRKPGSERCNAIHQAYGRVAMLMQQQASALAYKDVVSALAILVALPDSGDFIMKKPAGCAAASSHALAFVHRSDGLQRPAVEAIACPRSPSGK